MADLDLLSGEVFGSESVDAGASTALLPYTFGSMRNRLATFFSLDATDPDEKAILDECLNTGYEKLVSVANTHALQKEISLSTVAGTSEYSIIGAGVPTFVGVGSVRATYRPIEEVREMQTKSIDVGDMVYYSLVGFTGAAKKLVIYPTPILVEAVSLLCFQQAAPMVNDTDYPLVPGDWMWLILERAKVERLRFEGRIEEYQNQGREFVAYVKIFLNKIYPATPEPDMGFKLGPEASTYNSWRMRR